MTTMAKGSDAGGMDRREALKVLALTPFVFHWTGEDVELAWRAAPAARAAAASFRAQFFTDHEFATVRILADLIIPADGRSGSASDLGVPEFMDVLMTLRPALQTPMRGGLAWLDRFSVDLFEQRFAEATDPQRRQMLDAIAYPEDADPALSHGVGFFNSFRDLTASGFWTTREGMADVGYRGNQAVSEWTGPPESEIARLGLTKAPWPTI